MLVHLFAFAFFHTILSASVKPYYDADNYEVAGRHFETFIKTYNRKYDGDEKISRFHVFVENLKDINRLNKDQSIATFDINHFADWTEEERASLFGHRVTGDPADSQCKEINDPPTKEAPDAWDWRDKNVVSPVKDQAGCGSCWTFSTTGLVESRYLQQGKTIVASEQQLLDCDGQSNGCDGGLPIFALSSVIETGGLDSEEAYPYQAKAEHCRYHANDSVATVINCSDYSVGDEQKLKGLLYQEGPLSIAVLATPAWLKYTKGIFPNCDYGESNHAVLLVGYGSEGGVDYWIIKNSWGPKFGEDGFIKIKRGQGCANIAGNGPSAVVSATVQ